MLNLFDPIVVPGVEYVTVFQDDQDPHQFYMLPEFPTLAKTMDSQSYQFSLVLFSRELNLIKDANGSIANSETEGGLLTMATELSVSEADQAKITHYLKYEHKGFRPVFTSPGQFLIQLFLTK